MFGLSFKKNLAKAIVAACQNNRNVYKDAILQNIDVLTNGDESEQTGVFSFVRNEYLTKVFDEVVNHIDASNTTNISNRVRLAIMSPDLCGLEDEQIDNGVMAGSVYAICYWAVTNKIAKTGDCVALNHYQNDIMTEVIKEIQATL